MRMKVFVNEAARHGFFFFSAIGFNIPIVSSIYSCFSKTHIVLAMQVTLIHLFTSKWNPTKL